MTPHRTSTLLLTALLILILASADAPAERATFAEAELICGNWLSGFTLERGGWAGAPDPCVAGVDELLSDDGELLAWCFSIEPRGHVVVPVLRSLAPVKVYSETSNFDTGASIGFEQMLREKLSLVYDHFREEYGDLDALPAAGVEGRGPTRSRASRWERLLASPGGGTDSPDSGGRRTVRGVGPLLNTSWHQLAPYNGFCPEGNGGRCVVGCVALATAQVMYYYKWPPAGFGEFSYYWPGDGSCEGWTPGDILSAVFRDAYDWPNMPHDGPDSRRGAPDRYSSDPESRDRNDAVAELCYEVGVSMGTWYGHCASGAGSPTRILSEYFRYVGPIESRHGRDYSSEEWFALIQGEMGQDRPIIYYYPNHFLVCDGWRFVEDEMQIHMNYGGTGPYNGWYVIDDIHGHDWDHTVEHMLVNVFPDTGVMLGPYGNGDYACIQDAVDGVEPGAVISLYEGTYSGPGNRDIDFGGKAVTLRSHQGDPQICVIDAGGSESDPHGCVQFASGETAETVLADVWLTGGWTDGDGGGVYCADSSPTIEGCVIEGNTARSGGGVLFAGEGGPSQVPTISGCTIYGNEGGGVLVRGCDATIENTLIAWNTGGAAVSCDEGGQPELSCSDLYANEGGDWVDCVEEQLELDGNFCAGPVFCAPWDGVLTLSSASLCMPDGNSCGVQIGALGEGCESYVVHADGSGYFSTIQAAVDSIISDGATYNGSVVLSDGVFTGPGNRDVEVTGSVLVRSASSNAENCIIDCSGDGEDHRGLSIHTPQWYWCKLDSVTIANARAPSGSGAAVNCSGGAGVKLSGCRIVGCSAAEGGAVAATSSSMIRMEYCELSGNTATRGGAVYCSDSPSVRITASTLVGNEASRGSGIYSSESTLRMEGSVVAFGSGGEGVWWDGSSLDISCSDIYGNERGDWTGELQELLRTNDNFSADPLFCEPALGDYHVAGDSPCLSENACVPDEVPQVGAYGAGCDAGVPQNPVGLLWLSQNYPNPFNPTTGFSLLLPDDGHVTLAIYDLSGRLVATILDGPVPSGGRVAHWDGRNDDGRTVAAGVYFARLEQADRSDVRKLVLLK